MDTQALKAKQKRRAQEIVHVDSLPFVEPTFIAGLMSGSSKRER
ncbi:MAG: hypothetical protein ACR5LF_15805 [Symbiopectobacterium sp.]